VGVVNRGDRPRSLDVGPLPGYPETRPLSEAGKRRVQEGFAIEAEIEGLLDRHRLQQLELGAAGRLHVLMDMPVASIMVCSMSPSVSPAVLECRRECGNEPNAEEFLSRDFWPDRVCHNVARRNCDDTL
jgi:hypothetical protein